jgi:hypothetical protein
MPSTRKSANAALFVFICLLAALVGGLVLFLLYATPRRTGVPLLAGCALVAFGFAVVAIRVSIGYRRARRLELEHGVPPSRMLRLLELRQWLILTLGVAFLALATGAGTALRVIPADDAAASSTTAPVTAEPTTEVVTPTDSPTDDPSVPDSAPDSASVSVDAPDPTDTTDTADPGPTDVTDTPQDTPATKYLDTDEPLEGSRDADAVTFSAKRYLRGLQFYCSTDTESRIQWNVAGYTKLQTTVGIDDQTQNAYGVVSDLTFYNQDGHQMLAKPVEVSMGHPRVVSFNLSGATSILITCSGHVAKTNAQRGIRTALGDPTVTQ